VNVELTATIITGMFAGAATFISLVEHPVRMRYGAEFAIREFRPSLKRAHNPMASLALLSFILGMIAWMRDAGPLWLLGGLAMVANGPWTLAFMRPVNRQLMDPALELSSPRAARLIARWGHLHVVRSLLGCIGFLLFASGLAAR